MAEDAVFQRGEGMLDGTSPEAHHRGCSALAHAFQHRVMDMTVDVAPRRWRAAALERAAPAGCGGGDVQHAMPAALPRFAMQGPPRRAAEGVAGLIVAEVGAVEQGS